METSEMNNIANMLNELNEKYKDNSYVMERLQTYMLNLPNMLEQIHKKHDERVNRINQLTMEQENFLKVFLSKHQYYYMPYNSLYYEYDGKTYKVIKDDEIHYKLLSTITDEGKLLQWKHKTKQTIIRKIKERSLYKSTPETYTIQNVLGFLQSIFKTKTEAKYFLTILGDCILKKNTDELCYFVSSNLKKLVSLIDSIVYVTNGTSIIGNFITKYHDSHNLSMYRLISTRDSSLDFYKEVLNNIGIDLFCVATHYSERYGSSDNYLNAKVEQDIKDHILYFVKNTTENIVDDFVKQCITLVSTDSSINWKNMHYIWKMHLSMLNIPNMIYSQQLQELLMQRMFSKQDGQTVVFTCVTSKYLPDVSSFLSFWEKHITVVDNSEDALEECEYEIDELLTLYKMNEKKATQMTDESMIEMICHYFSPTVEVIDNKYVTNIVCDLWSKNDDLKQFLQSYKTSCKYSGVDFDASMDIVSFDELYQMYKNHAVASKKLIISKQYFEKYVTNQLNEFIKFDSFVSLEWILK